MIRDEQTLLSSYEIIIVGSGFAALPILEGLPPGTRILIIEGGGAEERPEDRQLNLNDEYGHFTDRYFANHLSRCFGGASRLWAGVVAPLDSRDFEGSRNLPAWPISAADIHDHYLHAADFLERDRFIVDFRERLPGTAFEYKPFSLGAPVQLGGRREQVIQRDGVDVLLHTNVVRLISADRKRVSAIEVSDADGARQTLTLGDGQILVLACGGLGNAQILLQPADGSDTPVGNESGRVGRYLMEHPHARCADVFVADDFMPNLPARFGPQLPCFIADDETTRSLDLLACTLDLQVFDLPRDHVPAAQQVIEQRFGRTLKQGLLFARAEQAPDPLNRVEITAERNWAGLHRLRTHCTFSTRDLLSIDQCTRLFGEMLARRRQGVVRIDNDGIYRRAGGGGHIMGTTRMGFTQADSVCDRNQRVHGYANLYLSGSSVFTTGGASNPTMTIIALARRLGDILRERLKKGAST